MSILKGEAMKRNILDIIFGVTIIAYLILAVPGLVIWGLVAFRVLTLTATVVIVVLTALRVSAGQKTYVRTMEKMNRILRELEEKGDSDDQDSIGSERKP